MSLNSKVFRWKGQWATGALSLFALLFPTDSWTATNTVTQTVNYAVPAVSVLSISGNVTFNAFSVPTAGQNFTSVLDTSSTYNVSNNGGQDSKKIVGRLVTATPTGLVLQATLTPPSGSIGLTNVSISTSDQSLVTGIDNGAFPTNQIKYTLTADVTTAPTGVGQTLNMVFTLVSGS